jgi:hypothetical protein
MVGGESRMRAGLLARLSRAAAWSRLGAVERLGLRRRRALGAESGCRLTSASLFCVSSICDSVTMLPAPPRPQVGMLDRDRKRAAFGLTSQLRRGMGEFFRVILRFFQKMRM